MDRQAGHAAFAGMSMTLPKTLPYGKIVHYDTGMPDCCRYAYIHDRITYSSLLFDAVLCMETLQEGVDWIVCTMILWF